MKRAWSEGEGVVDCIGRSKYGYMEIAATEIQSEIEKKLYDTFDE